MNETQTADEQLSSESDSQFQSQEPGSRLGFVATKASTCRGTCRKNRIVGLLAWLVGWLVG